MLSDLNFASGLGGFSIIFNLGCWDFMMLGFHDVFAFSVLSAMVMKTVHSKKFRTRERQE